MDTISPERINGAALALCAVDCPEAKKGGLCETMCEGARCLNIWNCSHLKKLRNSARRALEAKPAFPPKQVLHKSRKVYAGQ